MKKLFNYSFMLMLLSSMLVMTSCDEDDPIIIDPGSGSVNVADGLYLSLDGADPASSAGLSAEVVEANDFQSQDRSGFNAGYMWLEAGSYNVVQITDKEVTATIGGTLETVTDEGSNCEHNSFLLVTTAVDGPAFNVANAGLYKVSHDEMTSELILYNIKDASIIGSATPNGWSLDTPLTGTLSADGGSWSQSGVVLRSGEWKVRFNCRWGINRRIDPNGSLNDASNGYQMFTNFGGSTADLVTGGSNIQQGEDGEYTITVNWSKQNGFTLDAERTGDAPEITFNPNDYQMGIIGDATANGWDADRNLFHKEDAGVHTWYGVVSFADSGNWKFRANDAWDFNLGGELATLSNGGADIPTPGAGARYITLSTADEGDTWSATMSDAGWGVIGVGGPGATWDSDVDMTANGFADGVTTYSLTGDFTTEEWKFRAGDDWAHNLGGDLTFLNTDGNNIALGQAGTYTVTLSFNGEVYSATVQ